jgi:hypothetical protein
MLVAVAVAAATAAVAVAVAAAAATAAVAAVTDRTDLSSRDRVDGPGDFLRAPLLCPAPGYVEFKHLFEVKESLDHAA